MTLKEQLLQEYEAEMKPYFLWNEIWEKKSLELLSQSIDRVVESLRLEKKWGRDICSCHPRCGVCKEEKIYNSAVDDLNEKIKRVVGEV